MLRLGKSVLGAALLAGLTAAAVMTPSQADARPLGPHGHWVDGWYGPFGWRWAGPRPWYWYPSPVYYGYYTPVPRYAGHPRPAPRPIWYYCDSTRSYYPYVRSCAAGWRTVAAYPPGEIANTTSAVPPPPPPS
jgi:hypothetical protein